MALTVSKKALAVKPSSTLAITAKAKEMKANGIDVVGFVAGEPDFNTPSNVCEVAITAIRDGFTKYTPVAGIDPLRKAISNKFKEFNGLDYSPEQIVVSNGGKHSLTNVFSAILNPGDEVIIPTPYWLSYPEMVKMADGVPVIICGKVENNYKITAEQLAQACNEKTKIFVLNTPSNPTGMLYTREELEDIAQVIIEKDIYVVSDEMYEMLTYSGAEHVSIASLSEEIYNRTITCSGLSKSYAMTGWRVGYTGSSVSLAKLMSAVQSHATSNSNAIAQIAALEALTGDQSEVHAMKEAFQERRDYMSQSLSKLSGISYLEPQGAFYMFLDVSELYGKQYKDSKIESASQIADILLADYAVAVIPCQDFGSPNHIRLSYAISIEQIEKGMERIAGFLDLLQAE